MRLVKSSIVLLLLTGLAVAPRVVFAQVGAISDALGEAVADKSGLMMVSMTPPFPPVTIPEGPETSNPIFIPSRVIDFLESSSAISDRLTIGPIGGQFQIDVLSDSDPGGLTPRDGATVIPASAMEHFQPIRIEASSDGDQANPPSTESDMLTITLGWFGPGTGSVVFSGVISEPPEGDPETQLAFTIPPTKFDVEEPSLTGGSTGIISDYVDIIDQIVVTFLSSDDPLDYEVIEPSGTITEDPLNGGGVLYAIAFASDVEVPEPASFVLFGIAMLASTLFGPRRRIR